MNNFSINYLSKVKKIYTVLLFDFFKCNLTVKLSTGETSIIYIIILSEVLIIIKGF